MDHFVRRSGPRRNFTMSVEDETIRLPALVEGSENICRTCGQLVPVRQRLEPDDFKNLPAGFRFDPTDEELLRHLHAKIGRGDERSHQYIHEFISHLEEDDAFCKKPPESLPGVRKDGSSRHFFHKPARAYTTGTRKKRKINTEEDDSGEELRWHKTGKTRPVADASGVLLGYKKIMVLYKNPNSGKKKAKAERTNWICHQYHAGPEEEEGDGELVVCKVFFQTQPRQCIGTRQVENVTVDVHSSRPEPSQHEGPAIDIVQSSSDASRGTGALETPNREREPCSRNKRGFEPPYPSESSPPLPAPGEQMVIRTPAQSDVSLTLVLPEARLGPSQPLDILHDNGSSEWNDEASTGWTSFQNDASVMTDLARDDEHEVPAFQLGDLLFCTENFSNVNIELGPIIDNFETHQFEHVFEQFRPDVDYPELDDEDFLMSTPPMINSDLILSSQEASEWDLRVREYDPHDNSDSLSSN